MNNKAVKKEEEQQKTAGYTNEINFQVYVFVLVWSS